MATPTQGSGSSDSIIVVNWSALTGSATGNSALTTYSLFWDNASGTTSIELLTSSTLSTTYTVSGVSGGSTYRFKVRAKNIYGFGSFSTELVVTPSDVPGKASIPTTANSGTAVVVSWTAPNSHSSTIDAYAVLFKKSDGTFSTELTACDASTSAIVAAMTCSVPMATLITLTGLTLDSTIQVKVQAHNANGWGDYSELNIGGAKVETLPS
jgi:hypothetical protein